jgi:hypothetical protein
METIETVTLAASAGMNDKGKCTKGIFDPEYDKPLYQMIAPDEIQLGVMNDAMLQCNTLSHVRLRPSSLQMRERFCRHRVSPSDAGSKVGHVISPGTTTMDTARTSCNLTFVAFS